MKKRNRSSDDNKRFQSKFWRKGCMLKMKKTGKQIITVIALLGMLWSSGFSVLAAPEPVQPSASDIEVTKTAVLKDWENRTYQIELGAKTSSSEVGAADVVLVIDRSGSMDDRYDGSRKTKMEVLKDTAKDFISQLSEQSPASQVSVVSYASDSKTNIGLTSLDTRENIQSLNRAIDKLRASGATRSDLGLEDAYSVLGAADSGNKQFVIFLTDGEPNSYSGFDREIAARAESTASIIKGKDLIKRGSRIFGDYDDRLDYGPNHNIDWEFEGDPLNAEIFSIGILKNWSSQSQRVHEYLDYIDSQHSAALADTEQALQDIFDAITHQIAVTATVSDVLDSRFELTAEQKVAFDTAGVTYTENGDGTTTIVWTDKNLSRDGWQASIEVKAKDSFIGDNNVPTNAAGSGVSVDGVLVAPFASPTVNVRRLKLKSQDVDKTIFYGDSLRQTGVTDEAELEAMMLGWDDAENIRPSIGDVFDAPYNQGLIKKAWQPEPCTPEELDKIPDSGTVYKLSVTQSVNPPTEASTNSSSGNISVADDSLSGHYTVHVVKGQLDIAKKIDAQYTSDTRPNTNQSFVFKIERRDELSGPVQDTFYEVISFAANEDTKVKTSTVRGLRKGYYTVKEEDSWSWKYNLTALSQAFAPVPDPVYEPPEGFYLGGSEDNGTATEAQLNGTAPYQGQEGEAPSVVSASNALKQNVDILGDAANALNRFVN